jgi:methyltransferase (TIGR00027 family)
MRKNQSSLTAQGIAIVRAIESNKPAEQRICYDPYARRMVSSALFHFVNFFDKLGYADLRGPGVMEFLVVRERYIDDYLEKSLANGLDQLVILGAGYDARAYRFAGLLAGVKVFEVDHPATQEAKLASLKKIFGCAPEYVVYVPVDFNTQSLEKRLKESGYNPELKTLFIMQGVTQYLTPEAMDDTLRLIANSSGPGSSLIFDYMYTSLLDGTLKHGEVSNMRRNRWLSGEELSYGIPEGQITGYLEQRGFCDVHNADCQELQETHFTGPNAGRTVADGYAIASAVVNPSEKVRM